MSIKTDVYIVREAGGKKHIQQVTLPCDYDNGFFGELLIKFQNGAMVHSSIPRQSIPIQTITREDWEKLIGDYNE